MLGCLIYSMNVPNRWVRGSDRVEMCAEADWGPEGVIPDGGEVGTDGSSRRSGTGHDAGWGICWGPADARNQLGPVMGPVQTALRAE